MAECEGIPLAPGTYQMGYHLDADEDVPDAFVTVPSGYVESSTWFVVSGDGHEYLGLWTAAEADRDACRHGELDVYDPGPSVDDLARAWVATKSIRATEPVPVTLAGYQGQYVELASPRHMRRCRDPEAGLWTSGDGGRGSTRTVRSTSCGSLTPTVRGSWSTPHTPPDPPPRTSTG
jgi:hypothetical protein